MNKFKFKILLIAISIFTSFFFIFMPILLVGGVVATPFVAVASIFNTIGDFLFGDGANEAVDIMKNYFTLPEAQSMLVRVYQSSINAETRISVPLNYLVIPNMLIGQEDVANDQLLTQIESMILTKEIEQEKKDSKGNTVLDKNGDPVMEIIIQYELKSCTDYIDALRKKEPYLSLFNNITTKTIVGYIDEMQYLQSYQGLDRSYLSQFGDGDWIYPFKQKAIVTVEFNEWYNPFGTLMQHKAMDLAFPRPGNCGVSIYAVYDGVVVDNQVGKNIDVYGNFGAVQNGNILVKYIHMQQAFPYSIGDQIYKGDYIGSIGATGQAKGCHLHLQVEVDGVKVNPRDFIDFDNPKLLE